MFIVSYPTMIGKTYRLQATPDLSTWINLGQTVTGTGADIETNVDASSVGGKNPRSVFWRVLIDDTDPDGDSITSWEEVMLGTNPNSADTDLDGIPDNLDATPTGEDTVATTLTSSAGPQKLYNTMKRISDYRMSQRPFMLSTMYLGDSWSLNVEDNLYGLMGFSGYLVGPANCATTPSDGIKTAAYSDYDKTPFGLSLILNADGEYVTFGKNYQGSFSKARLQPSRYITVHYEAVRGGGSFLVQYEDRNGNWEYLTTINTDNGSSSIYTVYQSPALAEVQSPRIRTSWVSGSVRIYAAGASAYLNNDPPRGSNRGGAVICDTSYGGSSFVSYDKVPQSAWNALIGWTNPDLIFIRELREADLNSAWLPAVRRVISRIKTAKSNVDFVFVGSHPVPDSHVEVAETTDAAMRTFCSQNDHLFVDMRAFFPQTIEASRAIGLNRADPADVHLTEQGNIFARSVIWQHLSQMVDFANETDSAGGVKNMPTFTGQGVKGSFMIEQDGNTEDVYTGTLWSHRGGDGFMPGWTTAYWKRSNAQKSEGFSQLFMNNPYWQTSSYQTHFVSGTTSELSRSWNAFMEINASQNYRTALIASGSSGQSADIFQIRTNSSASSSGSVTAGADKSGRLFTSMPVYESHDAADADATLQSGGFYKLKGSRVVYAK
jgi:hypothetical protein